LLLPQVFLCLADQAAVADIVYTTRIPTPCFRTSTNTHARIRMFARDSAFGNSDSLECRTPVVASQECLAKVLFFGQLEDGLRARIAADMYERRVSAGEILIQEGDTGLTAAELYIVKDGEFEVSLT